MFDAEGGEKVDVSAEVLNEARRRRVTAVLEAFYVEREHVQEGDAEKSHPFGGDDVIYGNPHVTVGDWLFEVVGSGARWQNARRRSSPNVRGRWRSVCRMPITRRSQRCR
jgi:hypothetical protein